MNITDLRKQLRQSSIERRISDRRKISYTFGSPEWLEYMTDNNLKIPAEERRKTIRRSEDRKTITAIISSNTETPCRRIFLTPNERRLLQDIYLSDLD